MASLVYAHVDRRLIPWPLVQTISETLALPHFVSAVLLAMET